MKPKVIENCATCLIIFTLLTRVIQGLPSALTELNRLAFIDKMRLLKAIEMRNFMNTSVDPCEDFYDFVCGNFADTVAPIQASRLQILALHMDANIKTALAEYEVQDSDLDRNVKSFYRACVNVSELMDLYAGKLKELCEEFGQVPVWQGKDWQESEFDWLETVAKIAHKTDISIILQAAVVPDLEDNTINTVILGQPPLNFHTKSSYVDNPDHLQRIVALKLHKYMGVEMPLALQTAEELFEFELALTRGMTDDISTLQKAEIYNQTKSEALQEQYAATWDSMKLFNVALGLTPSQVSVDHKYLGNLVEVLATTPKRIVANHIFYSYLSYFMIRVRPSKSDMEMSCLTATKNHFYKYLDNMIYRKYFTEEMKRIVYFMWQELKSQFEDSLQLPRMGWLQPDTRQKAVEKLKAMTIKINSYENINLAEEYKGLDLKDNDYVHNIKSILTLQGNKSRVKSHLPPTPVEIGAASSFTPSYTEAENQLQVPVAILQPFYFYSTNYPFAYNFASLGSLLAHEILHGFDDNGRNYDAQGNNRNWWDSQSSAEFQTRTQCFIDQYKSYVFNGNPLPEMKLQSENIADNGGVHLAYEAYTKWYESAAVASQEMELMPGLDFTHTQSFFISYGQTWCSSENTEARRYRKHSDPHVPHKFRVIGPLSNFDKFSKEFNCPKGSRMNPETKCEIY